MDGSRCKVHQSHWCVALDGAGNPLRHRPSHHTIRKVAIKSGVVTTLVGAPGQAGSADGIGPQRGSESFGIASDGAGFPVQKTGNHTIRKIEVTTRSVATLAGLAGQAGSMMERCHCTVLQSARTVPRRRWFSMLQIGGNSTIRKIVLRHRIRHHLR